MAIKDGFALWNMYSGKVVIHRGKDEPRQFRVDGYPIKIEFTKDDTILILRYLENCLDKLSLNGKRSSESLCLMPDKWKPAATCVENDKLYLAAYSTTPKNGVKKKFPYYIPVINQFEYIVIEAGPSIEKSKPIRITGQATFKAMWHEESAGNWEMNCLGDGEVLLMNPSAEEISRISVKNNRDIWRVKAPGKPLDMVVDEQRQKAYIPTGAKTDILILNTKTGGKSHLCTSGCGTKLDFHSGQLFSVNPYLRFVSKENTAFKTYSFKNGLPTDLAVKDGGIYVSNGAEEGFWELDHEFNQVRYISPARDK